MSLLRPHSRRVAGNICGAEIKKFQQYCMGAHATRSPPQVAGDAVAVQHALLLLENAYRLSVYEGQVVGQAGQGHKTKGVP